MNKAILYKEWIKVHLYTLLAGLVWLGFTAFAILGIRRSFTFSGPEFVWLTVLEYNHILVDSLRYLPALVALGLALVQFLPEMQQNRLKLTLHLPVKPSVMIVKMTGFGLAILLVFYTFQIGAVWIYLHHVFATELVNRIMGTALVWYAAGIMTYLAGVWIVIEPTWTRRIFNALVTAGILHLLFTYKAPCTYAPMIPWILVWMLAMAFFPIYSADRFKRGCQD